VSVTFSTEYFSPDGDGVEDDLLVSIDARSGSELAGWRIEIREPSSNLLFSEWSGEGAPPSQIEWDGRSAKGELVQSASNYPFNITVTDAEGQSAAFPGIIQVDVLVIREPGDILRVQVPSIVFGPNSGGFDGVAEDIMANNDWILRRIAQVLNTFISYKVKVEGHANPTAATAAARDREQRLELQPLSEARAKTVVDYLVNLGVARNRLTPYGIGGARPVAALEDRDNWWKNRRVEFILEK
jgi:outer membrane protein OmpA-like peptidoglycan-associated protein